MMFHAIFTPEFEMDLPMAGLTIARTLYNPLIIFDFLKMTGRGFFIKEERS